MDVSVRKHTKCELWYNVLYVFFVYTYEEAEDITQETYSKAMAYLKKEYAVIENNSAYLKTIALNIIRDEIGYYGG
ncbi:hypothetical protein [Anaerocolumna jejuensis]|uniref:hypothetical protein n=1 Tax=Anaerocolumna jejuensis TaxID=259063 RepID=UPI003F7C3B52